MATGLLALLLCGAVQAHAVRLTAKNTLTPVQKVVQMVQELQNKVSAEGKAEAATYDKFACFCKSKTDEKTKSIAAGEQAVDDATTEINTLNADRDQLDEDIQTSTTEIAGYEAQVKAATDMRNQEKATFEAALADMEVSIAQIHSGIETLKNSAFMQGQSKVSMLKKVQNVVATALAMAEAMNMPVKGDVSALQAPIGDAPVADYTFHAGGIIETLEELWKDFRAKKVELEENEAKAESDFNIAIQSKKHQIEQTQIALDDQNKKRTETTEEIATANEDLTGANALLNDDRVYLKDLTTKCEQKAKEWDQRSAMRADELAALTQALTVLSGTVASKEASTGAGGRGGFIQTESFIQTVATVKNVRKLRLQGPNNQDLLRDKLVSMLRMAGKNLKSPALVTLATKVGEDPFIKIKGMIQEMIEKLLQEEADEANHKGMCDKELAKTIKDRDYRLRDVEELHTAIESDNARREKLAAEMATLTEELATLRSDLSDQTTARAEEKAENEVTVREAEEGVEAINQALDILSHFYGEAAQATVELQVKKQPSVDDEAPDTGFDGAYTGAQGSSTGIIGMMDVIKGDFERTIKDTKADEQQQKSDFVDYERAAGVSINTKQTGLDHATSEHTEVVNTIATSMDDLITQNELLDAAVKTWEDLIPGCVADPGMSYEERVARREAEVAALKDAYCILDNKEAGCDGVF
jgi:hypothetical protein